MSAFLAGLFSGANDNEYTGLLLYIVTKYESYFSHGSGLVGVHTGGPKH